MQEDNSGKLAWFFAGAAIGAAIALLYAPESGEVTRRRIGRKFDEHRERLEDAGRDLVEKGKDLMDEAADVIESGRKLVQG